MPTVCLITWKANCRYLQTIFAHSSILRLIQIYQCSWCFSVAGDFSVASDFNVDGDFSVASEFSVSGISSVADDFSVSGDFSDFSFTV